MESTRGYDGQTPGVILIAGRVSVTLFFPQNFYRLGPVKTSNKIKQTYDGPITLTISREPLRLCIVSNSRSRDLALLGKNVILGKRLLCLTLYT